MKEVTYITCPPTRAPYDPGEVDVVRAERGLRVGRDQTTTIVLGVHAVEFPLF